MSIDQTKKIAIVILNWNGKKFLEDCLTSVCAQTYPNYDIYFVDNGSTDDSVKYVTTHFPRIQIIQLDTNTGFAFGNNVGIQKAFEDPEVRWILTLNNDTKLDSRCLEYLAETIDTDPSVGAIAPKMKFFYEQDVIDSVGILVSPDGSGMNRGHREQDNGQYDEQANVFGVCAGAALYRREALEDVAYEGEFFDNSFFLYFEDIDLNWRLRLRGWEIRTAPQALVLHIHSGTTVSYSPLKAYYVNRNRYFLILKNFPLRYLLKAFVLTPLRYIQMLNSMFVKKSGASYQLKGKSSHSLQPFIIVFKGFGSFFMHIPSLLKKRRFIQESKKVSLQDVSTWLDVYKARVDDMLYKQ